MNRSGWRAGLVVAALGWSPIMADEFAVFPPDVQPPSAEDWFYYRLRRQLKGKATDCEPKAAILPEEIHYYPCPPDEPCYGATHGGRCGGSSHAGPRGVYGIFHPSPYYIQSPRLIVIDPQPKTIEVVPEKPAEPETPTAPKTPTELIKSEKIEKD